MQATALKHTKDHVRWNSVQTSYEAMFTHMGHTKTHAHAHERTKTNHNVLARPTPPRFHAVCVGARNSFVWLLYEVFISWLQCPSSTRITICVSLRYRMIVGLRPSTTGINMDEKWLLRDGCGVCSTVCIKCTICGGVLFFFKKKIVYFLYIIRYVVA